MPGYFRLSLDNLKKEVRELWDLGLRSVLLFVKVPDSLKDNKGTEALNPDGLMQRAIKAVKEVCPEMWVMTDVALDPYSCYGHDGIVEKGVILNDATTEVLGAMGASHAKAGADMVAPSDMMDGRILRIREALDAEGFENTGIMSYSAKYASAFYGPFRDALDSAPVDSEEVPPDKKTYQMNPANKREALIEGELDVLEGADYLMVKPALNYLDVIHVMKERFELPIAAYHVSGECAMLLAACRNGWLDYEQAMPETLLSIRRAGTDVIITYFAKDWAKMA